MSKARLALRLAAMEASVARMRAQASQPDLSCLTDDELLTICALNERYRDASVSSFAELARVLQPHERAAVRAILVKIAAQKGAGRHEPRRAFQAPR